MPPLTVTDIRLAFECPRLLYLGYHNGGQTLFLPAGGVTGIGSAFHQLADWCVRQLRQDAAFQDFLQPETLDSATLAQQIQQRLYATVFYPYLQATVKRDPAKAVGLHQIWQGLQGLIQRWAEWLVQNRRFCPPEQVIQKTFLGQELTVRYTFALPNGQRQTVTGRYDSLMYDFREQRLCVAEYKTYSAPDSSAQVVQVALYGLLLRETVGVPINSAVYSVLPDWREQVYPWEQLAETLHQLVPQKLQQIQTWLAWRVGRLEPPPATPYPHLCEICPQRAKCKSYFGDGPVPVFSESAEKEQFIPAKAPLKQLDLPGGSAQASQAEVAPVAPRRKPQPATPAPLLEKPQPVSPSAQNQAKGDAVTANYEQTSAQLVQTLKSFGVGVDSQGVAVGPAFIRVRLKPQLGVKVSSILRLSDDLRVQLGLTAPPMIAPQAGFVSVDLPRPDRQTAHFDQYVQRQPLPVTAPVQIAVGVNLDGELIEADLSDPNTCHFLVGGTTGSGKSEFLRSLLLSLVTRHAPAHLQIALVDPKRVTFPDFETLPWLLE
ncbi:MAG: PD-(D/E)XK nuclease family protein, partial [Cyanobacteria bacterium Co-bin13]|nr:PD-(D/E)XK nuclease family protein [Cyanobacteria bacterium Co-bin13]